MAILVNVLMRAASVSSVNSNASLTSNSVLPQSFSTSGVNRVPSIGPLVLGNRTTTTTSSVPSSAPPISGSMDVNNNNSVSGTPKITKRYQCSSCEKAEVSTQGTKCSNRKKR